MPTKEEVQAWAREEWIRLDQEKTDKAQAECNHARSGTVLPGTLLTVVCDDCGKNLTMDDATRSGPAPDTAQIERGGIEAMRAAR